MTYNRDLQEDKEPLFDSVATLRDSLEVMAGTLATLDVRRERMAQAAADPMLLATDLAELLVRKGVPFRDAHEVVGKIVGHCTRNKVDLRSLSRAVLQTFHRAFDAGADELLDLERSIESRSLTGGTARVRVVEALEEAEAAVAGELARLAEAARTGERGRRIASAEAPEARRAAKASTSTSRRRRRGWPRIPSWPGSRFSRSRVHCAPAVATARRSAARRRPRRPARRATPPSRPPRRPTKTRMTARRFARRLRSGLPSHSSDRVGSKSDMRERRTE